MKNTILLLTAILSLTACATDEEPYRNGNPGRPGYKPTLADTKPSADESTGIDESIESGTIVVDPRTPDESTGIDESIEPGTVGFDPRNHTSKSNDREWAEDIVLDGKQLTVIHHGLDYAELVDGDLVINSHFDSRQ